MVEAEGIRPIHTKEVEDIRSLLLGMAEADSTTVTMRDTNRLTGAVTT